MPAPLADGPAPDYLQAAFLPLLPRIVSHAAFVFRSLRCPGRRADAVQETVALAWRGFVRAARRGKDGRAFASVLATYAARRVRTGRLLCGAESARDALSPRAWTRHGFAASPLPDLDTGRAAREAWADHAVAPPPDGAAFRLDFPRWREGYGERDRALIDDLMAGGRTGDVAARHGLSPARVSQKRAEFHADWLRLHGEGPARRPAGRA
jgi:hypothetical protein